MKELEMRGDLQDTLVIFSSDNGIPFPLGKDIQYLFDYFLFNFHTNTFGLVVSNLKILDVHDGPTFTEEELMSPCLFCLHSILNLGEQKSKLK